MEETASTSAGEIVRKITGQNLSSDSTKEKPEYIFKCSFCSLQERIDYKGARPPFGRQFKFLEEGYFMKDPFSPLNKGEVLFVGGDCNICNKAVCLGCSIFYTKRFCQKCALENIEYFPSQIKSKIRNLTKDTNS